MHQFYELRGVGWHVYPDGYVARLGYVREGYAQQWALVYNMSGRKASAHKGVPDGHSWWDGDDD
jgi:beta-glucosidase/6-phospho-beta-glucosidase/beta-galactosidase